MPSFTTFWAEYSKALELAIAQQFICLFGTAFILDGGEMFRATLFAAGAHWVAILTVIIRRPVLPTRFDLALVRFGFVPVGVAAWIIAALMGRTV